MDDVDVPTFELFFEWSLMPQPALRDFWTVDQVLQLAQLGETYKVYALKNQVASRLRDCLVSKWWKVTPQLIRHLWQMSSGNCGSGLYLILSVGLGIIPDYTDIAGWKAVMNDHPSLYRLHSDACLHKFTLQSLQDLDICDLHDHSWHTKPRMTSPDKCHLERDECYPEGWIEANEEDMADWGGRALCDHCRNGARSPTPARRQSPAITEKD